MDKPATILMTGFTRNGALLEKALESVRALKRSGHASRVLYVTWDSAAIDPFVAPLKETAGIELVRVREPQADGTPYQRGVVYQVKSLEAALAQVSDKDALILKLRPDFVAREAFLRAKIEGFGALPPPRDLPIAKGIAMPKSPFARRIWLPWADANQPFWFEDAAFMGLKRDVERLVTPLQAGDLDVLADTAYGPFAHVLRFAKIFAPRYPIFTRYLANYRYFPNDMEYRRALVPQLAQDSFFWHLVVANAWILATSFHIDCGQEGDLALYGNNHNAASDWSNLASLRVNNPYDQVEAWRAAQQPGKVFPCVLRVYGRLVDDAWQNALFGEAPELELTRETLRTALKNNLNIRTGALAAAERGFYEKLDTVFKTHKARAA